MEWGRLRRPLGEGQGAHGTRTRATQASPLHASSTPAPTGTKALPKRRDKKPPPESGSGVDVGRGRLRRPRPVPQSPGLSPHGRRKRPHPSSPYKYRFFAGPASQAEGEHVLDMCSNAFSGGFRGSLSKKPILVRLCWRMTHRMELGLMIAKTRPIWRPFDLHLRPISARFNQECHSPTKS